MVPYNPVNPAILWRRGSLSHITKRKVDLTLGVSVCALPYSLPVLNAISCREVSAA